MTLHESDTNSTETMQRGEVDDRFDPRHAQQLFEENETDAEFMDYMNCFFVKVVHEQHVIYGNRNTTKSQYNFRKQNVLKFCFPYNINVGTAEHPKMKCIMWYWCRSHKLFSVNQREFNPKYVGDDPLRRSVNLYSGFQATLIPDDEIRNDLIEPLLKHVRKLNNDDADCSEYVLNWLASLFQTPWETNRTSLLFYGPYHTYESKGVFFNKFIGEMVVGLKKHYQRVVEVGSITAQRNQLYRFKTLILVDDVMFRGGGNNVLDALIGQNWKLMRGCDVKHIRQKQYLNFIFLSEDESYCAPRESDHIFSMRVGKFETPEYYENLTRLCEDQEVANNFYTYLMRRDISTFDAFQIPRFSENASTPTDPFDTFIQRLSDGEVSDEHARYLHGEYKRACLDENRLTIQQFTPKLKAAIQIEKRAKKRKNNL